MRLGGDRAGQPQRQPEAGGRLGPGLTGGLVAAGVILLLTLLLGVANVEVTEYGLNYSLLTRRAEPKTYGAGRYWIGPLNFFIKYPSTVTTIQFSDTVLQQDLMFNIAGDKELRSRTKDGLDVQIELSFQYQIMPDRIYDLFLKLGGWYPYHQTFVRLAIDGLTECATQFSATEFFTERTKIGQVMEERLRKESEKVLYATIFSFQLRSVGLPKEFEEAIQQTEVMKQDIKVSLAEQNSTKVSLETKLIEAKTRTKVAAAQAEAQADSMMLANDADIAQFKISQEKSADAFGDVLGKLDGNEAGLFAYMQARALRDHASSKVTVGLDMPTVENVGA